MEPRLKYVFLLLLTLLAGQYPLFTQEDEDEENEETEQLQDSSKKRANSLEEIVVTGTRTEKMIIDIPYSVFRVEKEELLFGRDLNAKDILQDVPGLFIQTRFGSEVRISIRGFGSRSNTGVRGIRILMDGIPESEPDGETTTDAIDYTSLGGVEVVKGNLSSLYPNSPGGVVNFLSDFGFKKNFVRLNSQFGSYGLKQNGLRFGLTNMKSRLFVSYTYKNYTGYRDHGAEYSHLLNANFSANIDRRTTLYILSNYTRGFLRFPGALTKNEYVADPYRPYFQAVASDFKRDSKKGRIGIKLRKYLGKNNVNEFEFLGFGAVKDIEYTTNELYNIKNKYVLGSTIRYTNRSQVFGRENDFTAGADYNYVTGPLSSFNNTGGQKGDDLQAQSRETQSNYGIFIENQLNILKGKLYFLVSGRYDKVSFNNSDELFTSRNSSKSFERFTPKTALNLKLTSSIAVYTSYGLGFDTPSASELENFPFSSNGGFTTLNPDIVAQTSRNFEIGIKGDLENSREKFPYRTVFELTLFNTIVKDEIIPLVISDRVFYRNAARTNRLGAELGLKIKPVRRTSIIFNYTFTDFKYREYISRTYSSSGEPSDMDFTGNLVPAVPKHLVNLILEGEPRLSRHLGLILIFDCDYVSRMFTDDQNTESDGAYMYANAMAGLNFAAENFVLTLSAGVRNFLDRKYVGFININANPEFSIGERRYYEPGEPRNYYTNLIVTYKF